MISSLLALRGRLLAPDSYFVSMQFVVRDSQAKIDIGRIDINSR